MAGDQKFNLLMHVFVYVISVIVCFIVLPDFELIIVISIWYLLNFSIHAALFLAHKSIVSKFNMKNRDFFFLNSKPQFDSIDRVEVICSYGLFVPFMGSLVSWMGDYFYFFVVTKKDGTKGIISSEYSEELNIILHSKTKKEDYHTRVIAFFPFRSLK